LVRKNINPVSLTISGIYHMLKTKRETPCATELVDCCLSPLTLLLLGDYRAKRRPVALCQEKMGIK
jgi:hypothetical protein